MRALIKEVRRVEKVDGHKTLWEKSNSKFEGELLPDVPKLFKLVKKKRFNELVLVAHDVMVAAKSSAGNNMNVAMYSHLMTKRAGTKKLSSLPIFKHILQAGATPNVISYAQNGHNPRW
jgi:hypothetical protein